MILRGGFLFNEGRICQSDIEIDGKNSFFSSDIYDLNNLLILPGLVDVHVHFRQPGFSYKETILSGSRSAVAGGFTAVCTMPNLNPCPDCAEALKVQTDIIEKDAVVRIFPYGCITIGEKGEKLADMESIAKSVIGFSDDGRGVQSKEIMKEAMILAKRLGKPIVAHCEDESLLEKGWAINESEFARKNGLTGNNPASEYKQIERDLELVAQTGVKYHVCHISTAESVSIIREAKKSGLPVSCETAPHYLTFTDEMLKNEGRFKMNPPIRAKRDREALLKGVCDGTIDVIATDHAPHSAEEKSKGLSDSLNGVVGLEISFAATYTKLVCGGYIGIEKLVDLMSLNARKIFCIEDYKACGDYTVVDINKERLVDSKKFVSLGKATPFDGEKLKGAVVMTIVGGKVVYCNERYGFKGNK